MRFSIIYISHCNFGDFKNGLLRKLVKTHYSPTATNCENLHYIGQQEQSKPKKTTKKSICDERANKVE